MDDEKAKRITNELVLKEIILMLRREIDERDLMDMTGSLYVGAQRRSIRRLYEDALNKIDAKIK